METGSGGDYEFTKLQVAIRCSLLAARNPRVIKCLLLLLLFGITSSEKRMARSVKKTLQLTPVFPYFAAPNFTHVKGYSTDRTKRYP